MQSVRPPAAAGRFYPAEPGTLRRQVAQFLDDAATVDLPAPRAIIAPHAGYPYSGPIAASAFAPWLGASFTRVIMLGPAHYVHVAHVALPTSTAFATPLGHMTVDREAVRLLRQAPGFVFQDEAHRPEHSLEVELPFLQRVLPDAAIVPLLVGAATPRPAAKALQPLLEDEDSCLLVSSDLSHFHSYRQATTLDEATSRDILSLKPLGPEQACGYRAINILLTLAESHHLEPRLLDVRNSGDTSGDRDRVVGYGAFAFEQRQPIG